MNKDLARITLASCGAALAATTFAACSTPAGEPAGKQSQYLRDLDGADARAVQRELVHGPLGFKPLSREPVPQPTNGTIINQAAAVRLGKAFFWDTQAGSDGQVACAVCHASFGTDARRVNTMHPGFDGIFDSNGVTGPGQTYTPGLMPLTSDDAIGVQGVVRRNFVSINPDPHIADENCDPVVDPVFGTNRRVEFRQAPMIYGAVFLRQLFWAGEANNQFNGLTIWGLTGNNTTGAITQMENSALASQAVGPAANSVEMRCTGRPLNGLTNSLAAKLLARPPLQFQRVSRTDSVLGALANPTGPGLVCGGAPCAYRDMIAQAFGPEIAANAELTFSRIWGEAIQAYESTLRPDRTPFDQFLRGRVDALTSRQIAGLVRFVGKAGCATCHAGAMLSDATVSYFQAHGPLNRDGGDQGFHNIGLVETNTDFGRGALGPGGILLSVSQNQFDFAAFKTPTLRNIGLTAPYFHNGSYPTLDDVVEFYNRGGDAPNEELSRDIRPLGLTAADKRALIDFMVNGLTDCRVKNQRAPFDHPSLPVPNGVDLPAVGANGIGSCDDDDNDDHHDDDDDDDGHGHGHGH